MKCIGLDIGTTSICGVVVDSKSRKPLLSMTRKNETFLSSNNVLERCQSPEAILKTLTEILEELLSCHPDVESIGLTGQMHGILYTNQKGVAISPLYTWQDQQGEAAYRDGMSYTQFASRMSGYTMANGYGFITLFYHTVNNLIPEGAAAVGTIADYAVMRLCGLHRPTMHVSNAASLGCFDLKRLQFDFEAVQRLGIDVELLPEVVKWPKAVGYYHGIPVTVAIGDNQASFLGSGADEDTVLVNVGTGSQVSVTSNAYVETAGCVELRPYLGDRFLLVGSSLSGGRAYALLESFFRKTAALAGVKVESLYGAMDQALSGYNENVTLQISTLFDGTRGNPASRGSITNITVDNFTPEQMMLGFAKGIAEELYSMYRDMPVHKHRMLGSGNGIQKNHALINAVETLFQMPLSMTSNEEEAACGAAMCFDSHNG